MRKAFNFYRSYYDVAKELSKKDREEFLMAILRKQFEGIEPALEGMVNFAYLSQKHSIDSQVKGYEDKTKQKLLPIEEPLLGGSVGGAEGGSVQEKEKEKVEYTNREIKLKAFKQPLLEEVILYFTENGFREDIARRAYEYYNVANWKDSNGKQVRNWKQKMNSVWFKEEHKKINEPIKKKSVDDLYAENVMKQYEENLRRNDTTGRT